MAIKYFCDGSETNGFIGYGVVEVQTNSTAYYSYSPKCKGSSLDAEMFGILKCLELVTKTRHKIVSIYTDREDAVLFLNFKKEYNEIVFCKDGAKSKFNWSPVRKKIATLTTLGYTVSVRLFHPIKHKTWFILGEEIVLPVKIE